MGGKLKTPLSCTVVSYWCLEWQTRQTAVLSWTTLFGQTCLRIIRECLNIYFKQSYRNGPKFSDMSGQTEVVWSGSTLFVIPVASFELYSIVVTHCSNFRVIIASVRIFRFFYATYQKACMKTVVVKTKSMVGPWMKSADGMMPIILTATTRSIFQCWEANNIWFPCFSSERNKRANSWEKRP